MRTYNKLEDLPGRSSWVRINGYFLKETEKAIAFLYTPGGLVWYPKSRLICINNGMSQLQFYVQKWLLSDRSKGNK